MQIKLKKSNNFKTKRVSSRCRIMSTPQALHHFIFGYKSLRSRLQFSGTIHPRCIGQLLSSERMTEAVLMVLAAVNAIPTHTTLFFPMPIIALINLSFSDSQPNIDYFIFLKIKMFLSENVDHQGRHLYRSLCLLTHKDYNLDY